MGPLAGVRVLDLSRVLAGPYCAQLLADMGAEVVKAEAIEGDENRRWAPFAEDGMSCNFGSVNRGKRDIALDLKTAGGRDVLHRLVRRSDVVIQSFRAGAAKRLGVDYEAIRAVNPDAIVCSISGYGGLGPMADDPGYDLMVQAFAGIMSTTGEAGQTPVRVGVSFLDLGTGMLAYGGITTALLARKDGAPGQHVQVSLMETAIAFLGYHAVAWLNTAVLPRREGSGVWHLVPYQAFQCTDGHVLVGAPNDAAWRRLCGELGRPEWADDPRFRTNDDRIANRAPLIEALSAVLREGRVADWAARLTAAGVASAPLQTVDQVMTHPQVLANGMVVENAREGAAPMRMVGLPFKLSGTPGTPAGVPPRLGEHTQEVLAGMLGLDEAAIAALEAEGAIRPRGG